MRARSRNRRRLDDLAEKPGLGEAPLAKMKAAAERRMAIVDTQPDGWRDLLNDYHHKDVAYAADVAASPKQARSILEQRHGKAI